MPKPNEAADTPHEAFDVTLEEFCTRLSAIDKRVELIGGFYADARANGVIKESEAKLKGLFDAFANAPV